MAQQQIQKVGWWHERLADWMIANPDRTLREAAKVFNCSEGYLSIIKNSDAFKAYWEKRSAEASEHYISGGLIAKTAAAADMALDRLIEKLEAPNEILQAPQMLDIADTMLKRLGYGAKPTTGGGGGTNVNVNIGLVSREELAAAREKLKALHGVQVSQVTAEEVKELQVEISSTTVREGEILPPSKPIRNVGG